MSKRILLIASAPLEQVVHTAEFIEEKNPGAEYSLLIKKDREQAASDRLPGWKIITYKEGAISPWNKELPGIEELRRPAAGGVYYAASFVRPKEYLNVELLARCINPNETHAIAYPIREANIPLPEEAGELLRSGDMEGALKFMEEYRRSNSFEYAIRSTVSTIPPASVQILTSPDCNYSCVMCPTHSKEMAEKHGAQTNSRFIGDRRMGMKEYASLIDDISDMGVEHISICAGGEPLMDENLPGIVNRIYERGVDCDVYTNGYLLDGKFRDLFISRGVKIVRISLNAGTSGSFSQIHNVAQSGFVKVIDNVRALVRERDAAGAEWPKVGLSFVVSRLNFDEAGAMLEIGRDTGVDWVYLAPACFDSNRPFPEIEIDNEQVESLSEKVSAFIKSPEYKGVPRVGLAAERWSSGYRERKDHYLRASCYLGWSFAQISSFGDVYPCCVCDRKLGNILNGSFREVWNSSEYVRMREEMLALPEKKSSIEGCDCFEGCPHVLWNENLRRRIQSLSIEESGAGPA